MMLVLNNVCAAHPNLIAKAKYAAPIIMLENKNTIGQSILKVAKMIPDSINDILPHKQLDPWWGVRNIINPVIILFGPHFILVNISQYLHTAVIIMLYLFVLIVQSGFIGRYMDWTVEEGNLAIAKKLIEEEQKLD